MPHHDEKLGLEPSATYFRDLPGHLGGELLARNCQPVLRDCPGGQGSSAQISGRSLSSSASELRMSYEVQRPHLS